MSKGIRVAQEEKLEKENSNLADMVARMEAKQIMDKKFEKKFSNAVRKIKSAERRKREDFMVDYHYQNNPWGPYGSPNQFPYQSPYFI